MQNNNQNNQNRNQNNQNNNQNQQNNNQNRLNNNQNNQNSQNDQNSQNGFWGYVSKDAMEGRFIALEVEKMTRVDIMLYDDNDGLLQHYGMKVEPVEGGWNVTLDKNYITSLGAAVLRKFS